MFYLLTLIGTVPTLILDTIIVITFNI